MKKFMYLHVGFEKPTPEVMNQWKTWFESIADRQIEQQGFACGKEITKDGVRDLPWDENCLTGFNIIEAENMEDAEKLAEGNPFISSIRIYELR